MTLTRGERTNCGLCGCCLHSSTLSPRKSAVRAFTTHARGFCPWQTKRSVVTSSRAGQFPSTFPCRLDIAKLRRREAIPSSECVPVSRGECGCGFLRSRISMVCEPSPRSIYSDSWASAPRRRVLSQTESAEGSTGCDREEVDSEQCRYNCARSTLDCTSATEIGHAQTRWNTSIRGRPVPSHFVLHVLEMIQNDVLVFAHTLGKRTDATWVLWILSTMTEPVALKERSQRFRRTRTKILSLLDPAMRVVCERFTIPVRLRVWLSDDRVTSEVLESVRKLKLAMDDILTPHASDPKEEERRAALRAFPFRIASVDLTIDRMKVTPALQSTLDQVAATQGLQLGSFSYSSMQKISKETFGVLIRSLMVGAATSPVDAELHLLYDILKASGPTLTATQLAQVFSTLLDPSRFSSLTIMDVMDTCSPTKRRWVWLWLIHALFSSSAVHSITHFELHIKHLKDEDITAIREYLRSTNPVALLCQPTWEFVGVQDPASQQPRRASLPTGTTLLLNPFRRRFPEPTALPLSGWFDVIQEDVEFVDVVVPGYGQCRVKKSEVTEWQVSPAKVPQSKFLNHSAESLKIWVHRHFHENGEFGDDGSANLMALVELIGQPAVRLDLWCRIPRSHEFFRSIWTNCPNVKLLLLHRVHLHSLMSLVNAYESELCRVPSLELTMCPIHDGNSIIDFTEALGDPTKKISTVLREFAFSENMPHFTFANEDFADMANMLGKNKTLRYFALTAEASELPKHQHLFAPHDNQILEGFSEPLSIDCKSAFLSVVERANDPEKAVVIPAAEQIAQFDSRILSTIFEFACVP